MSDTTIPLPDTVAVAAKKYGGRNEIMSRSGKLAEREVEIDDTTYLVRELTGLEYARLIGLQARARLNGNVDLENYQKQILLAGVCDPESPQGARTQAFSEADMQTVMGNGSGFLELLIGPIEELSGLGQKAKEQAEKQLGEAASTSGLLES